MEQTPLFYHFLDFYAGHNIRIARVLFERKPRYFYLLACPFIDIRDEVCHHPDIVHIFDITVAS